MAAVSARRMCSPSDTDVQPFSRAVSALVFRPSAFGTYQQSDGFRGSRQGFDDRNAGAVLIEK